MNCGTFLLQISGNVPGNNDKNMRTANSASGHSALPAHQAPTHFHHRAETRNGQNNPFRLKNED